MQLEFLHDKLSYHIYVIIIRDKNIKITKNKVNFIDTYILT